ncbi:MAG: hypothetical protein KBS81_00765, partial [Spirochaetales bacterium]|nr:hypothetical protein [Candidatus Physcosoma equi]
GLAEHAKNVIDGTSKLLSMSDLAKAYAVYSPGAHWNGAGYVNADTGVKSNNTFLVNQDTYIMGKDGDKYMHATETEVPEWAYTTK